MNTENLQTLKIHKLTQTQYDRELEAENLDETALYLTPDDSAGKKIEGVEGAEIFNDYRVRGTGGDTVVGNIATGQYSHAEGQTTEASGHYSHAEGCSTTASGVCSHAEGLATQALGKYSHSEGYITYAYGENQHVQGKYNIDDTSNKYAHIVGNGTNISERSNAHTLDWEGNAWYAGNVYIGGSGQDDSVAKKLSTTGQSTTNETAILTPDTTAICGVGAEIFNDYRERTFFDEGFASHGNIASGEYSHAEGSATTASGERSHAEGSCTRATGHTSHAEGYNVDASGAHSHAEGFATTASGTYGAHAEGQSTIASGSSSHAEGVSTTASGEYSHAEGYETTVEGSASHSEGWSTLASGLASHSEGDNTEASGDASHSEGRETTASNGGSHAEGYGTTASGVCSHAEGHSTTASGDYSHSAGYYTTADNYQYVVGKYNAARNPVTNASTAYSSTDTVDTTYPALFIVGNGTGSDSLSNAFTVYANGKCKGLASFGSSGADYARQYEWLDGNPNNEDRRGLLVILEGSKIRMATSDDDIEDCEGIVSTCPAFVENDPDEWHDRYLKDVFGRRITQEVVIPEETITKSIRKIDEETGEVIIEEVTEVIPEHTVVQFVVNPEYDPEQEYVCRDVRPEWTTVGFSGFIVAIDDGTCQVNGYCTSGENGVLTTSETRTAYRVMERKDDNHILVRIK